MTPEEWTELLDLSVADELPEALQAKAEDYLAAHPEAAQDLASLRAVTARLRAAPQEHPDDWFTERLLDSLLREHLTATQTQGEQKIWQRPPLRRG